MSPYYLHRLTCESCVKMSRYSHLRSSARRAWRHTSCLISPIHSFNILKYTLWTTTVSSDQRISIGEESYSYHHSGKIQDPRPGNERWSWSPEQFLWVFLNVTYIYIVEYLVVAVIYRFSSKFATAWISSSARKIHQGL